MSQPIASVHLRPGHVQPIWAGHPWVYAQAIDRIDRMDRMDRIDCIDRTARIGGTEHADRRDASASATRGKGVTPAPGDEVQVVDPQGNLLGRGFWSPRKAIPVRLVVRDERTSLDEPAWLIARIEAALRRRRAVGLPNADTNGYRLLHAEGDDVPGLVLDHFGADADGRGGVVVAQIGTAGLHARSGLIFSAIRTVVEPRAIVDRTSEASARGEGFSVGEGISWTAADGSPLEALRFVEHGLRYSIPLDVGQKTGFYFDQRGLRARVESLSRGRRVLDAYCYVGPIAMAAKRGGATSVLALDDSLRALEIGAMCAQENGLEIEFRRADVRRELTTLAAAGERYQLIVLDPPKLAPTRGDRDGAAHYTSRLVETACAVADTGAILIVCSCSTAFGMSDLARALAIGARRAGRHATILERLGQGADHPVPAAFPEGLYLSTIIAEIA